MKEQIEAKSNYSHATDEMFVISIEEVLFVIKNKGILIKGQREQKTENRCGLCGVCVVYDTERCDVTRLDGASDRKYAYVIAFTGHNEGNWPVRRLLCDRRPHPLPLIE